jgi:hypothetical protein
MVYVIAKSGRNRQGYVSACSGVKDSKVRGIDGNENVKAGPEAQR